MLDHEDIAGMLARMNIPFKLARASADTATFEIGLFGIRVVWHVGNVASKDDGWRYVFIKPEEDVRKARMDIVWELARGGYFHYLRMNYPNTFKQMLAGRGGEDWHRIIISKRLESYGNNPKYSYVKALNQDALKQPSTFVLAMDPGFYDFLLD